MNGLTATRKLYRTLSTSSITLLLNLPNWVNATEARKGVLDFNFYPYLAEVENDTVFTLNTFVALPRRFSYFSLLNIYNQNNTDAFSDTSGFYTEQNLRWQITETSVFDLTAQYNMRSGENNDRMRLGIRWRLNDSQGLERFFNSIGLRYAINFHLWQWDHSNAGIWQMEHVFALTFPFFTERLYVAGFIDHTFGEELPETIPTNPAVMETQLGFRLFDDFYIIVEYRVSQYRRENVNNLAAGFEYKFKW